MRRLIASAILLTGLTGCNQAAQIAMPRQAAPAAASQVATAARQERLTITAITQDGKSHARYRSLTITGTLQGKTTTIVISRRFVPWSGGMAPFINLSIDGRPITAAEPGWVATQGLLAQAILAAGVDRALLLDALDLLMTPATDAVTTSGSGKPLATSARTSPSVR